MDVKLPDGTVVQNVPDGISKADLIGKLKANGYDISKLEESAPSVNPAKGVLELGAALGSAAVAGPVAGLAGIAGAVVPGPEGQGARMVERVSNALTYQPRTKEAQDAVGLVAAPFEYLASKADQAGAATAEATGSPLLGAAVNTGIQALPMAAGPAFAAARPALAARGAKNLAASDALREQNAVRDTTVNTAMDEGYVMPPSANNPTWMNKKLESIAGKAATTQEAQIRNQVVTNRLAREELGLGPNTPITVGVLDMYREMHSGPYREVAKLPPAKDPAVLQAALDKALGERTSSKAAALQEAGKFATEAQRADTAASNWFPVEGMPRAPYRYSPNAERVKPANEAYNDSLVIARQRQNEAAFLQRRLDALKDEPRSDNPYAYSSPAENLGALRDARAKANEQFRFYEKSANPDALREAKTAWAEAEQREQALEFAAKQAGRTDLVDKLRAARTKIAKSYDIEHSLNLGDANVDARNIGKAFDKGKPLTGNLETIGKFSTGPGFNFTREGGRVPTPGVSALEPALSAVLAAAAGSGGRGLLAAGVPLIRDPVRSLVLSEAYQRNHARPNYGNGGLAARLAEMDPNAIEAAIAAGSAQRNKK